MKYAIKIHKISTVDELPDAWKIEDYKELLERFDFKDAEGGNLEELKEFLFMAIADLETNEAAVIVLDYLLSEDLSKNQIEQLSHEMLLDKITEEYPEIHLHLKLYNANQLLYKAFNGKFPNTKATIVDFEIAPLGNADKKITKEIVLKCFAKNVDNHNVANRLFGNQIKGDEEFDEANHVIWDLQQKDANYRMITSDYWMGKDEFLSEEFEAAIEFFEEED
jgi:hypothetical protein